MEIIILILFIVIAVASNKKKEQARKAEQEARRRAQGGQPYTPPPTPADAMPGAAFEPEGESIFPTLPPNGRAPYVFEEGGGPRGSLRGGAVEGREAPRGSLQGGAAEGREAPRGSLQGGSTEGWGAGGSLGGGAPIPEGPLRPSFPHTVQSLTESPHRHMETSLTGDVPCPPVALVKPQPQRTGKYGAQPVPVVLSAHAYNLSFAPEDVRKGILYAEILNKPRALRR